MSYQLFYQTFCHCFYHFLYQTLCQCLRQGTNLFDAGPPQLPSPQLPHQLRRYTSRPCTKA